MATGTFAHIVYLSLSGSVFTVQGVDSSLIWTVDSNTPSSTINPGDLIGITISGGAGTWTYEGQGVGGLVGSSFNPDPIMGGTSYFALTNTPPAVGTTFSLEVDPFVLCFLSGTLIATPRGEVAVEELRAGDLVLTHDGREAPVVWLGRQTVSTAFADPLRVAPVRIAAGALGEGLPVRDLLVSADHALLLDGVLVQAGALVHGRSITRETAMPERFTYYHVELADHALVLAEGVAAESFIDNAARRSFDNWAEHPGGAEEMAELALPRAKSHRQVPAALRARLAARAEALLPAALAA